MNENIQDGVMHKVHIIVKGVGVGTGYKRWTAKEILHGLKWEMSEIT